MLCCSITMCNMILVAIMCSYVCVCASCACMHVLENFVYHGRLIKNGEFFIEQIQNMLISTTVHSKITSLTKYGIVKITVATGLHNGSVYARAEVCCDY